MEAHLVIADKNENTRVIANQNGRVVQIPADQFTGGSGSGDTPPEVIGEIPPEVTNAIETHGMGWTTEEEVPAINITWDGDTEGREAIGEEFFKVSDKVYTKEDLIGATVTTTIEDFEEITITSVMADEDALYVIIEGEPFIVVNLAEDGQGTYFVNFGDSDGYITSLTQSAGTREVVHKIDDKYSSDFTIKGYLNHNGDPGEGEEEYTITITTPVVDIMENLENVKYAELFLSDEEEFKWSYMYEISEKLCAGGQVVLHFHSYGYSYSDFGDARILRGFVLNVSDVGSIVGIDIDFIDPITGSYVDVKFSISDGTITRSSMSPNEVKSIMGHRQRTLPKPVIGTINDDSGDLDYAGLGACVLFKGEPAFDYLGNDKFRISVENGEWVLNSES